MRLQAENCPRGERPSEVNWEGRRRRRVRGTGGGYDGSERGGIGIEKEAAFVFAEGRMVCGEDDETRGSETWMSWQRQRQRQARCGWLAHGNGSGNGDQGGGGRWANDEKIKKTNERNGERASEGVEGVLMSYGDAGPRRRWIVS